MEPTNPNIESNDPQNNPVMPESAPTQVQQTMQTGSPVPLQPSSATVQDYTNQTMPKSTKNNKKLIIGLAIGGFLILVVIAAIVAVGISAFKGAQEKAKQAQDEARQSQSDSQANKPGSKENSALGANSITARYITEFDAVCEGGAITNAAQFVSSSKPYKVAAFSYNEASPYKRWDPESLLSSVVPSSDTEDPSAISVVACAQEKPGSAVKSTTCTFQSSGGDVVLDYYALKYEISFKEAKTGKSLGKGSDVNGPAIKCPTFASYDKTNPRLYADPDTNALSQAVQNFVQ